MMSVVFLRRCVKCSELLRFDNTVEGIACGHCGSEMKFTEGRLRVDQDKLGDLVREDVGPRLNI